MNTDRKCLFGCILAAALLLPANAPAEGPLFPSTLEGVGCFENLIAPDYPAEAVEKKMDGFVWATVQLGAEGKIASIETNVISETNGAAAVLAPPVEKALRAANAKPACSGKTISIDFRYELPGDAFASTPGEASYVVHVRPKKSD
jgi:hypothetical protein